MSKQASIVVGFQKAIAKAEKAGQTQYRIAKLAGMPQSQVARVASGKTIPTLATAERIAKAIGLRIEFVPIVA